MNGLAMTTNLVFLVTIVRRMLLSQPCVLESVVGEHLQASL